MKKGVLICNRFWQSASMSAMEARFLHAAQRLDVSLSVRGNGDFLPLFPSAPAAFFPGGTPDFVLFWDKDTRLCRYMEGLGVSVFNSSTAITLCDDKTLTHLALHGFPVPPTVLCPLTFPGNGYGDFSFLDRAAEAVGYPMVIKEGCGSLGQQVYLARDRREAADILQRIGGATALMQRFVRESAGRDKRLYMVDGQCAAAIERRNSADFRANIAAGGSAMPYRPTEAEVRLARDCCDRLGLVFAGVDLLDGSDGTLVCEVNSNAHFTALEQATGADIAGAILSAVRRRL